MTDREMLEVIREGRYRELLYDLLLEFPDLVKPQPEESECETASKPH